MWHNMSESTLLIHSMSQFNRPLDDKTNSGYECGRKSKFWYEVDIKNDLYSHLIKEYWKKKKSIILYCNSN